MPTKLVTPEGLCGQPTKFGEKCTAPRMRGHDVCYQHNPSRMQIEQARAKSAREARSISLQTDLDLPALMALPWDHPDALAIARRGIWQHLLAGSIRSDAARAALDVAEQLATASRRKDSAQPMASVMASVIGTTPPQPDDG